MILLTSTRLSWICATTFEHFQKLLEKIICRLKEKGRGNNFSNNHELGKSQKIPGNFYCFPLLIFHNHGKNKYIRFQHNWSCFGPFSRNCSAQAPESSWRQPEKHTDGEKTTRSLTAERFWHLPTATMHYRILSYAPEELSRLVCLKSIRIHSSFQVKLASCATVTYPLDNRTPLYSKFIVFKVCMDPNRSISETSSV